MGIKQYNVVQLKTLIEADVFFFTMKSVLPFKAELDSTDSDSAIVLLIILCALCPCRLKDLKRLHP